MSPAVPPGVLDWLGRPGGPPRGRVRWEGRCGQTVASFESARGPSASRGGTCPAGDPPPWAPARVVGWTDLSLDL